MQVALGKIWTERLCRLPETGMGYQRLDLSLRNGRTMRGVLVFNAEVMDWPDEAGPISPDEIVDMRLAEGPD